MFPLNFLPLSFKLIPLLFAVAVQALLPMMLTLPNSDVTSDCLAETGERAAIVSLYTPFYVATVTTTIIIDHSAATISLVVAAVNFSTPAVGHAVGCTVFRDLSHCSENPVCYIITSSAHL